MIFLVTSDRLPLKSTVMPQVLSGGVAGSLSLSAPSFWLIQKRLELHHNRRRYDFDRDRDIYRANTNLVGRDHTGK